MTDKQANDLPILVKGCRDVLNDTEQYLRKNESLGTESSGLGSKTKTAWRKLKWDPATVNQLRDRMVANATYLNAFNTSLARSVFFVPQVWTLLYRKHKNWLLTHTHPVKCPERQMKKLKAWLKIFRA